MYARKRANFMDMKLYAEMLFRFQWQMENLLQELDLSIGFISISPLILVLIEQPRCNA